MYDIPHYHPLVTINCKLIGQEPVTRGFNNPDKPELHLPMGMKNDVHNMYMEEVRLGENELQPVSRNYFNAVWRK